ncbi:MAG TPA: hypothetical protein VMX18_01040 [Candidatus Bipolaricaulota bacterium]|nr:hypothetical protein [Candidatus Bipolaricaulota bacterium]
MKQWMCAMLALVLVGCWQAPQPEKTMYNPNPMSRLEAECPQGTFLLELNSSTFMAQFCSDSYFVQQGPFKEWEHGRLSREGQALDDKAVGQHTFMNYDRDGNVAEIRKSDYNSKGEQDGFETRYYADGQVEVIWPFTRGMENGITEWYYPSGSLGGYCNYLVGLQDGECASFFPDGRLWEALEYDHGRLVGAYLPDSPATFVDAGGNGYVEYLNNEGLVTTSGRYENGRKEGCWQNRHRESVLYMDGKILGFNC